MKKLLLILLLLIPSLAWGAFPVTSVLSTFTGDENPLSESGMWAHDIRLENTAAAKVGGVLTGSVDDYWDAIWNSQTFGPQCEAYVTLVNEVDGTGIVLRLKI